MRIHVALIAGLLLATTGIAQDEAQKKVLDPKATEMNQKAPDVFWAQFETSKGNFVIEVDRAWAPLGADRFYNLVRNGFYDEVRFFRVIAGFMAQFGLSGDPKIGELFREAKIKDDKVVKSNTRGNVTFAMGGPNTRTTQLFISLVNNARLDKDGFSPFGKVIHGGMKVVDKLHAGYGEGAPRGNGPSQGRVQTEGNEYLNKDFPKLDHVKKATILKKKPEAPTTKESDKASDK